VIRSLDDVTVEAVLAGELTPADVRIGAEALERQAAVAAELGNLQLAENFLRAAELTHFEDAEVLAIYDALRPGRSSRADLERLAGDLRTRDAERCAALVEEALAAYEARGLLK
jgi:propanediol dehydratase small subunit